MTAAVLHTGSGVWLTVMCVLTDKGRWVIYVHALVGSALQISKQGPGDGPGLLHRAAVAFIMNVTGSDETRGF